MALETQELINLLHLNEKTNDPREFNSLSSFLIL